MSKSSFFAIFAIRQNYTDNEKSFCSHYADDATTMLDYKKKLRDRLLSVIGIKPSIHIVEPNAIERSQGKAKHVNDKRKLK